MLLLSLLVIVTMVMELMRRTSLCLHCEVLCGVVSSQGVNVWSVTTCSRLVRLQPVLHSWQCCATKNNGNTKVLWSVASVDDGFNMIPLTSHCSLLLEHCCVSIGAQQTKGGQPRRCGACKCWHMPGMLLQSTHEQHCAAGQQKTAGCVYLRNQGWQRSSWPSGLLLAPSQFPWHPAASLFCNHCNTCSDLPWHMLG